MEFLSRLFSILDDFDQHDDLYFRTGQRFGGGSFAEPASFFINCNDLFYWATADLEEITPENIDLLEQSFADAKAACQFGELYGGALFAARSRGMRPQQPAYAQYPAEMHPLFDAAGPVRDRASEG